MSGCTGTEVQDPYEIVAGKVVSEDGAAAARASVYLVRKDYSALVKRDSFANPSSSQGDAFFHRTTDDKGHFKFDSIPFGDYDLWANDFVDDNAAIGDSFSVSKYTDRLVFNVSLKPKKAVVGIVRERSTGQAIVGASCAVKGTPLVSITESNGIFKFSLPDGSFDIDCRKDFYDHYSRQAIVKVSDSTPTLTITLTNTGKDVFVPAPQSVAVTKDPVTGVVRVSWSKPEGLEVFNYSVRRIDIENPAVIRLFEVGESDSDFYDIPFGGAPVSLFRKDLLYAVACVKRDGKKSEYSKSLPNVETITRGADLNLRFADAVRDFAVGDTARLIGEFSGGIYPADRFNWTLGEAQDSLRLVDSLRVLPGSDLAAGRDTLVYPCTAPGSVGIRLTIRDKSGGVSVKLKTLVIAPPP
ncbi:MAG: carboxypeptidase-like regulatory domain-containing protein [Fibrobacterota bacterium]|nr:carboxypeptidase-like regulatory domain-containing protein [Fibrobacterota bacterium]